MKYQQHGVHFESGLHQSIAGQCRVRQRKKISKNV